MSTTNIYSEITKHFPYVLRPVNSEITVHGEQCFHCSLLIEQLEEITQNPLSKLDLRTFIGELSLLSKEGFRWVLPHYLEVILDDDSDDELAEYFIYNLSVKPEETEKLEHHDRFSQFTNTQLSFLMKVVEHLRTTLSYAVDNLDIDKAINELNSLKLKLHPEL